MSNYIIDVTKEEHKDIPVTLNGEVLLEKTVDDKGNLSGYLTTTQENIIEMKKKTDEELKNLKWDKYKHILDSFE